MDAQSCHSLISSLSHNIHKGCPQYIVNSSGSVEPVHIHYTGPKVVFSCSTQLSMKFFLLINIKMPTVVGILIFISRKNFMLSSALQEKSFNCWCEIFYKQNKIHSQLS